MMRDVHVGGAVPLGRMGVWSLIFYHEILETILVGAVSGWDTFYDWCYIRC
ncbi:hypothetical protein HG66A1_18810 [Gimesia chilikensis]|uniref:Uncharacterized protein n=1 Tax=Gimesia chilikensis TaxID=2605989 RepID=A0A517PL57_9PLAN|nr:hypothetical protein HG66A1_18810 [Gimesia chilikensis]